MRILFIILVCVFLVVPTVVLAEGDNGCCVFDGQDYCSLTTSSGCSTGRFEAGSSCDQVSACQSVCCASGIDSSSPSFIGSFLGGSTYSTVSLAECNDRAVNPFIVGSDSSCSVSSFSETFLTTFNIRNQDNSVVGGSIFIDGAESSFYETFSAYLFSGSHSVEVFSQGYDSFEQSYDISSQSTIDISLTPNSQADSFVTFKISDESGSLGGVSISEGSNSISSTNSLGVASFSISPGSHSFDFFLYNYQPFSKSFDFSAGSSYSEEITLSRFASCSLDSECSSQGGGVCEGGVCVTSCSSVSNAECVSSIDECSVAAEGIVLDGVSCSSGVSSEVCCSSQTIKNECENNARIDSNEGDYCYCGGSFVTADTATFCCDGTPSDQACSNSGTAKVYGKLFDSDGNILSGKSVTLTAYGSSGTELFSKSVTTSSDSGFYSGVNNYNGEGIFVFEKENSFELSWGNEISYVVLSSESESAFLPYSILQDGAANLDNVLLSNSEFLLGSVSLSSPSSSEGVCGQASAYDVDISTSVYSGGSPNLMVDWVSSSCTPQLINIIRYKHPYSTAEGIIDSSYSFNVADLSDSTLLKKEGDLYTFIDTTLWDEYYSYDVVLIGFNVFNANRGAITYSGDSLCENIPATLDRNQGFFCVGDSRYSCTSDNVLDYDNAETCSSFSNNEKTRCLNTVDSTNNRLEALCVSDNVCSDFGVDYRYASPLSNSNFFGLFADETFDSNTCSVSSSGELKTCFVDSAGVDDSDLTGTPLVSSGSDLYRITDSCVDCESATSCTDYNSKSACETDWCSVGYYKGEKSCNWVDNSLTDSIGNGVCISAEVKDNSCDVCSDLSGIGSCNVDICSSLNNCGYLNETKLSKINENEEVLSVCTDCSNVETSGLGCSLLSEQACGSSCFDTSCSFSSPTPPTNNFDFFSGSNSPVCQKNSCNQVSQNFDTLTTSQLDQAYVDCQADLTPPTTTVDLVKSNLAASDLEIPSGVYSSDSQLVFYIDSERVNYNYKIYDFNNLNGVDPYLNLSYCFSQDSSFCDDDSNWVSERIKYDSSFKQLGLRIKLQDYFDVSNGLGTIFYRSKDQNFNLENKRSLTFTIDLSAPEITFSTSVVGSDLVVDYSLSEPAYGGCRESLWGVDSGKVYNSMVFPESLSSSFSLSNLNDDEYALIVTCSDGLGNFNSSSKPIYVDANNNIDQSSFKINYISSSFQDLTIGSNLGFTIRPKNFKISAKTTAYDFSVGECSYLFEDVFSDNSFSVQTSENINSQQVLISEEINPSTIPKISKVTYSCIHGDIQDEASIYLIVDSLPPLVTPLVNGIPYTNQIIKSEDDVSFSCEDQIQRIPVQGQEYLNNLNGLQSTSVDSRSFTFENRFSTMIYSFDVEVDSFDGSCSANVNVYKNEELIKTSKSSNFVSGLNSFIFENLILRPYNTYRFEVSPDTGCSNVFYKQNGESLSSSLYIQSSSSLYPKEIDSCSMTYEGDIYSGSVISSSPVLINTRDFYGNSLDYSLDFDIDSFPPNANINNQEKIYLTSENEYTISSTFSDDDGVNRISSAFLAVYNGNIFKDYELSTSSQQPINQIISLNEGINTVELVVSDISGRISRDDVKIYSDTVPPRLVDDTPIKLFDSSGVLLNARDDGLYYLERDENYSVEIKTEDPFYTNIVSSVSLNNGEDIQLSKEKNVFSGSFNASLSIGSHNLPLTLTDISGNVNSTAFLGIYVKDTSPPVLINATVYDCEHDNSCFFDGEKYILGRGKHQVSFVFNEPVSLSISPYTTSRAVYSYDNKKLNFYNELWKKDDKKDDKYIYDFEIFSSTKEGSASLTLKNIKSSYADSDIFSDVSFNFYFDTSSPAPTYLEVPTNNSFIKSQESLRLRGMATGSSRVEIKEDSLLIRNESSIYNPSIFSFSKSSDLVYFGNGEVCLNFLQISEREQEYLRNSSIISLSNPLKYFEFSVTGPVYSSTCNAPSDIPLLVLNLNESANPVLSSSVFFSLFKESTPQGFFDFSRSLNEGKHFYSLKSFDYVNNPSSSKLIGVYVDDSSPNLNFYPSSASPLTEGITLVVSDNFLAYESLNISTVNLTIEDNKLIENGSTSLITSLDADFKIFIPSSVLSLGSSCSDAKNISGNLVVTDYSKNVMNKDFEINYDPCTYDMSVKVSGQSNPENIPVEFNGENYYTKESNFSLSFSNEQVSINSVFVGNLEAQVYESSNGFDVIFSNSEGDYLVNVNSSSGEESKLQSFWIHFDQTAPILNATFNPSIIGNSTNPDLTLFYEDYSGNVLTHSPGELTGSLANVFFEGENILPQTFFPNQVINLENFSMISTAIDKAGNSITVNLSQFLSIDLTPPIVSSYVGDNLFNQVKTIKTDTGDDVVFTCSCIEDGCVTQTKFYETSEENYLSITPSKNSWNDSLLTLSTRSESNVNNLGTFESGQDRYFVLGCFGTDVAGNVGVSLNKVNIDNDGPNFIFKDSNNAYYVGETGIYYTSSTAPTLSFDTSSNAECTGKIDKVESFSEGLDFSSGSSHSFIVGNNFPLTDRGNFVHFNCTDDLGNSKSVTKEIYFNNDLFTDLEVSVASNFDSFSIDSVFNITSHSDEFYLKNCVYDLNSDYYNKEVSKESLNTQSVYYSDIGPFPDNNISFSLGVSCMNQYGVFADSQSFNFKYGYAPNLEINFISPVENQRVSSLDFEAKIETNFFGGSDLGVSCTYKGNSGSPKNLVYRNSYVNPSLRSVYNASVSESSLISNSDDKYLIYTCFDNKQSIQRTVNFVYDVTPPSVESVLINGRGLIDGISYTNLNSSVFSANVIVGNDDSVSRVTLNDVNYSFTYANNFLTFSFNSSENEAFDVKIYDLAGNLVSYSFSNIFDDFVIKPSFDVPSYLESNSLDSEVMIVNTGEPGTLYVSVDGVESEFSVSDSSFSYDFSPSVCSSHSISAKFVDLAGNVGVSSSSITRLCDSSGPIITVPFSSEIFGPVQVFKFLITDEQGVDVNSLVIDSVDSFTVGSQFNDSGLWVTLNSNLVDGSHSFNLTIMDVLGNPSSFVVDFVVDSSIPSLLDFSPVLTNDSSSVVSFEFSSPVVVWNVTSSGSVVDFSVSGSVVNVSEELVSGNNLFEVSSSLVGGLVNNSYEGVVYADLESPSLTLGNGLVTTNEVISLFGSYVEDFGIRSFVVSGVNGSLSVIPIFSNGNFVVPDVRLSSGDNVFTFVIEDFAGNVVSEDFIVSYVTDRPFVDDFVIGSSIWNGSVWLTGDSSVVVSGNFSSASSGVVGVSFGGFVAGVVGNDFSVVIPLSVVDGEESLNSFVFSVVDEFYSSISNPISIVVDKQAPVLSFGDSVNSNYVVNESGIGGFYTSVVNPEISFTTSSVASCKQAYSKSYSYLEGSSVSAGTSHLFVPSFDENTFTNRGNFVHFNCTDDFGNSAVESKEIFYNVDSFDDVIVSIDSTFDSFSIDSVFNISVSSDSFYLNKCEYNISSVDGVYDSSIIKSSLHKQNAMYSDFSPFPSEDSSFSVSVSCMNQYGVFADSQTFNFNYDYSPTLSFNFVSPFENQRVSSLNFEARIDTSFFGGSDEGVDCSYKEAGPTVPTTLPYYGSYSSPVLGSIYNMSLSSSDFVSDSEGMKSLNFSCSGNGQSVSKVVNFVLDSSPIGLSNLNFSFGSFVDDVLYTNRLSSELSVVVDAGVGDGVSRVVLDEVNSSFVYENGVLSVVFNSSVSESHVLKVFDLAGNVVSENFGVVFDDVSPGSPSFVVPSYLESGVPSSEVIRFETGENGVLKVEVDGTVEEFVVVDGFYDFEFVQVGCDVSSVSAWLVDLAGNVGSSSSSITRLCNNIGPSIFVSGSGSVLGPVQNFVVSLYDGQGVSEDSIEVKVDGVNVPFVVDLLNGSVKVSVPLNLSQGSHSLSVYVEDVLGNSNEKTITFSVNENVPSLLSYLPELTNKLNTKLNFSFLEDDVVLINASINGADASSVIEGKRISLSGNLVSGNNSVNLFALRSGKSVNGSYFGETVVDLEKPSLNLSNDLIISKELISLRGNYSDNGNIKSFTISGVNGSLSVIPVFSNGNFVVPDVRLSSGDNVFTFVIEDFAGNVRTESKTITYITARPAVENIVVKNANLVGSNWVLNSDYAVIEGTFTSTSTNTLLIKSGNKIAVLSGDSFSINVSLSPSSGVETTRSFILDLADEFYSSQSNVISILIDKLPPNQPSLRVRNTSGYFSPSSSYSTDNPFPSFELTYEEDVVISASLKGTNFVPLTIVGGPRLFTLSTLSSLLEPTYFLEVNATDTFGNVRTFSQTVGIDLAQFRINLNEPTFGISSSNPTVLNISTNRESSCRWFPNTGSDFNNMWNLSSSNKLYHSQDNFDVVTYSSIYVSCFDDLTEEIFSSTFNLVYDTTLLDFELTLPLITDTTGTLTVNANKEVVCYYEAEQQKKLFENNDLLEEATYQTQQIQPLTVGVDVIDDQSNTVEVTCIDRSKNSLTKSISQMVITNSDYALIINSPSNGELFEGTSDDPLLFSIYTNKRSICNSTSTPTRFSGFLNSQDGFLHEFISPSTSQGEYNLSFACNRLSTRGSVSGETSFVIDKTSPRVSVIEINPDYVEDNYYYAINDLRFIVYGTDNYGIDYFNVSLYEKTDLIDDFKINAKERTIDIYELSNCIFDDLDSENGRTRCYENSDLFPSEIKNVDGCVVNEIGKKESVDEVTQIAIDSCVEDNVDDSTVYFFNGRKSTELDNNKSYSLKASAIDFVGLYSSYSSDSFKTNKDKAPATCNDDKKNGGETDVDCGGECGSCLIGDSCIVESDCVYGSCTNSVCSLPSCSDGVQNGQETDIDCGGSSCSSCEVDETCNLDSDCSSDNCNVANNVCEVSICENNRLDVGETDIDCGGSCSVKGFECSTGDACVSNSDCSSNNCVDSFCKTADKDSDSDGIMDSEDNCISRPNKNQEDLDLDGIGDVCDSDIDGDGLSNDWELQYFNSETLANPYDDPDGDSLTNLEEFTLGTNPNSKDTDGDGIPDNKDKNPLVKDSRLWPWLLLFLSLVGSGSGFGYYLWKKKQPVFNKSIPLLKKPSVPLKTVKKAPSLRRNPLRKLKPLFPSKKIMPKIMKKNVSNPFDKLKKLRDDVEKKEKLDPTFSRIKRIDKHRDVVKNLKESEEKKDD